MKNRRQYATHLKVNPRKEALPHPAGPLFKWLMFEWKTWTHLDTVQLYLGRYRADGPCVIYQDGSHAFSKCEQ